MKVKRMIQLLLVLFSVIPMIFITAFSIGRFTDQSMQLIRNNTATAAQVQADQLQHFFQQLEANMRADAQIDSIKDIFTADGEALEQAKWTATQMLGVRVKEQSYLHTASIVGLDGRVLVSTDPTRVDRQTLLGRETVQMVHQEEFHVTDVRTFAEYQGGVAHLALSHRIAEQGEPQGFLIAVVDTSYFDQMIQNTRFFKTGSITVMDAHGNVAATSSSYLTTSIDAVGDSDLPAKWKEINFRDNSSGSFTFTAEGSRRLGCYFELSGTGWTVLTAVDYSEILAPLWGFVLFLGLLFLLLLVLIGICGALANRSFTRPLGQILSGIEQMRRNDHTARIEYHAKNEFGQISAAFNELMDHLEEDNRVLRESEARYRIVTEQADNNIFEYNLLERTVYHTANWSAKLGYRSEEVAAKATPERELLHPDDLKAFQDLFRSFENKEREHGGLELRLLKADGSWLWCSVHATAMVDGSGRPYKVIGTISDVDDQKRETEMLRDRVQKDPLTGLYNRAATEVLISRALKTDQNGKTHALLVIDVDNFKAVNDNLGHLFGDAVLSEVAANLLSTFSSSDVVGRIGGDEFVVFLGNLPSDQFLFDKLERLAGLFRHSYTGNNQEYKISGSVGVAVFPRDGNSYKKLFENADKALYAAKSQGKDCYSIFDPQKHGEQPIARAVRTPERQKNFSENITEYVFQILYQSDDVNSSVQRILELVGRYYNVSRAYVIEYTQDGQYMNNTFEWCNSGIEPQKDQLQQVSDKALGGYSSHFEESNIFYVKDINDLEQSVYDILAPQGIQSMLQCSILNDGEFCGYVGFDECSRRRFWTQEEIETLSLISKILSVFLIKMRTQAKLERTLAQTRSILDAQDMWTYVVDRQSHELLFVNRKARELALCGELGDKCYKVFWGGRTAPCECCPMRDVNEHKPNNTKKIFNNHFQVWTSATASLLNWEGRENVCLICCMDITDLETLLREEEE